MKTLFDTKDERHSVARDLSQLTRCDVLKLELDFDEYGWIPISQIIDKLKIKYKDITINHIFEIVEKDPQKRFSISNNKIRAKAGHRYIVLNTSKNIVPPSILYHGTSPQASRKILKMGISKMGKSYVHLTDTIERALIIGKRKSSKPIILKIDARKAHSLGIRFWKSGQISSDGEIYLTDEIPATFISEKKDEKH